MFDNSIIEFNYVLDNILKAGIYSFYRSYTVDIHVLKYRKCEFELNCKILIVLKSNSFVLLILMIKSL